MDQLIDGAPLPPPTHTRRYRSIANWHARQSMVAWGSHGKTLWHMLCVAEREWRVKWDDHVLVCLGSSIVAGSPSSPGMTPC